MLSVLWLLYLCSTATSHASGVRDLTPPSVIEKRIQQSCHAISPVPSRLVCEELGHAQPDDDEDPFTALASPQIVPDLQTCIDFCLRRTTLKSRTSLDVIYCRSFGYNQTSGLCSLSSKTLQFKNGSRFRPNNSSSTLYSSAKCYECAARCPQQANSANLIDNPGFELSDTLVGPWASAGEIVRHGFNSSNAAAPAAPNGSDGLKQYFNTCPGQLYSLKYDFYFGNAFKTGGTFLGLIKAGDLVTEPGHIPKHKIGWAPYEFTFRANRDVSNFQFVTSGTVPGGLYVDNVIVTPISNDPILLPDAQNLLVNSDFETGAIHPWIVSFEGDTPDSSSIVSPGLGPNSQFALQVKLNSTDPTWNVLVKQSVRNFPGVKLGTKFLVTVNYKATGTHGAPTLNSEAVWNDGDPPLDREPEDANGVKTMQRIVTSVSQAPGVAFGLNFDAHTTDPISDEVVILLDNISIKFLD